jgi:hypothetical protein
MIGGRPAGRWAAWGVRQQSAILSLAARYAAIGASIMRLIVVGLNGRGASLPRYFLRWSFFPSRVGLLSGRSCPTINGLRGMSAST